MKIGKLKLILFCLGCIVCFMLSFHDASAQQPKLFLVNAGKIAMVKKAIPMDVEIANDVTALKKSSDKLFNKKILSVVDKAFSTPCGNKHEYMSMASYFWPDPSKPDGKPYIRKDGQRNPDNEKVTDHKGFDDVIKNVTHLSWAYYFSNDEKYAKKAVEILHFWFVDTATNMLPNLNHAQIIMGVDTGRGIGIIDIHLLPEMIDALGILENSPSFGKADKQAVHEWFNQFLTWLRTSHNGTSEANTKNNHKTFYESLVASMALYCGRTDIADAIFKNAPKLLAAQFEIDGKQPLELERTNALSYSTFNLKAWFMLASLASNRSVDLWHYQTADGRSLKKALDFLLPYALGEKKWTYQQINPYEQKELYSILAIAADKFNDKSYKAISLKLKEFETPMQNLFYKYADK